jgi:hypothetical protein
MESLRGEVIAGLKYIEDALDGDACDDETEILQIEFRDGTSSTCSTDDGLEPFSVFTRSTGKKIEPCCGLADAGKGAVLSDLTNRDAERFGVAQAAVRGSRRGF